MSVFSSYGFNKNKENINHHQIFDILNDPDFDTSYVIQSSLDRTAAFIPDTMKDHDKRYYEKTIWQIQCKIIFQRTVHYLECKNSHLMRLFRRGGWEVN